MKKYNWFTILAIMIITSFYSCGEALDTYEQYDGRKKYSSKISNLTGEVGIEKVVLNWDNPQDDVAKKIRIEYGDDMFIEIESMVSTYMIENLSSGAGYDFTIFTIDEFGNKSIGTSIFLLPYSSSFVDAFVESVTTIKPTSQVDEDNLIIKWNNLVENTFLHYSGIIDYQYIINGEVFSEHLETGNNNQETITIPGITSPTTIDLSYTMFYQPIINNTLVMDTIFITETAQIVVSYPSDGVSEKIDHSQCEQVTNIPFDNTTQHSDPYNFYNMFDGNLNSIWISARPDNDPVHGGNAQNNSEFPLSFTIDLGKATVLSALEFTGWEDYSQAPKNFEVWGTNEIKAGQPDSYWTTTIPGNWQNEWQKLATCNTDNFNRSSIKYNINPDKHQARYVRIVVHEIYKLDVQWDGVYIRIAIGELIFYQQPGMISRITF